MKISEELQKKALTAKSAKELLKIAEKNQIEITPEQAENYYSSLHADGQISDNELDNVAGGCDKNNYTCVCPHCGKSDYYRDCNGYYYCLNCGQAFKYRKVR